MECTSSYHLPITRALQASGLFVSTVNPQLIHGFGNNSIRKRRNDKTDALKIANYGLANWMGLPGDVPDEDIR